MEGYRKVIASLAWFSFHLISFSSVQFRFVFCFSFDFLFCLCFVVLDVLGVSLN